ncbi:MAG: sigma-70 family RNA polymerase sigma factor [Clostridia bacterium]|nr:sigma-70 family RNA polymerase sigma factor [Clostridia bacterium]
MLDEVKNLIVNAQAGDEKAADELVRRNIGLVRSAVRRFLGRGVSDEDLFQLGAMGLVKAIKRFDVSYNVEFSTYAVPMIIGEIRRFLRDDGIIKVSRSARERAAIIRRIRTEEGDCEIDHIAARLGISYEDAVFALEATTPPESMDKELFEGDGSRVRLGDMISDKDSEEERVTKIALNSAIEQLCERDRQIIELRYFKELTQSQVARILNIGQVQVSRLEKKIIANIREKIS